MQRLEDTPACAVAVYAHPDDPEVSCGGTLARWAAGGAEVWIVVATQGDKGSADPATDPVALAEQRAAEVTEAARVLGVAGAELLGYPDGELDNTVELRHRLVRLLRTWRPDVVLCPDPTAVFFGDTYLNHADHRAIGWATLDAVAPSASAPLYFPDAGDPHQVSTVLLSGTLEADVAVDVSATLEVKVDALLCHRSQLGPDTDWLRAFVAQRAEQAGEPAGLAAAETFRRLRLAPT